MRNYLTRTKILVAAGLLLLAALIFFPGSKVKQSTYEVLAEDLVLRVEASGTLESTDSAIIKPPRIEDTYRFTISYMAPEGKMVTPETVLVRFDAQEIAKRMELKKSQLASNQKRLEIMRLEEKEKLELVELDLAEQEAALAKATRKAETPVELMAGVELARARFDAELAQLKVQTAQRKLASQKENMEVRIRSLEAIIKSQERTVIRLAENVQKMTIKAPKPGLLVYKTKWDGNKYAQGETAWMNSNLMEIPDLNSMVVSGVIEEPDAGKVSIGQEVDIRLDANPDKLFKGHIIQLGKVFHRKSRKTPNIVFDATISIDNPDPDLMRPGMAARLKILLEKQPDVIQIPENAVSYDDEGPYVRIKGSINSRKRVRLGRHVDGKVEVLEGLEPGEQILLGKKPDQGGEA